MTTITTPLGRLAGFGALSALLVAALLAGCHDTSPPHMGPPAPATLLSGRAVDADGQPATGVDVYVAVDRLGVHVARTATDGTFRSDAVPTGEVEVVLNDRQGRGTLRAVVVRPVGPNDLGDLLVEPLEHFPLLVDIHGVGFEERVTRGPGHLEGAVFASDGSFLIAARLRPGWPQREILKIDTTTGAEEIVAAGVLHADTPIRLYGDRVVGYGLGSDFNPTYVTTRLHVLSTGKEYSGFGSIDLDQVWLAGDRLFYFDRLDRVVVGGLSIFKQRLVCVDLATGAETTTVMFADGAHITGFDGLVRDEHTLVYAPNRYCAGATPLCSPEEASGRRVYRVSLDTMESRELGLVGDFPLIGRPHTLTIAGTPAALYLPKGDYGDEGLQRMDLETGVLTDFVTFSNVGWSYYIDRLFQLPGSGQGSDGFLARAALTSSYQVTLLHVALDGSLTPLDLKNGAGRPLCQVDRDTSKGLTRHSHCAVEQTRGGGLRVSEVQGIYEQPRLFASVDLDAGRHPVRHRVLSFQASGNFDPLPPLVSSLDESRDAVALRDAGFVQLFVGDMRGDGAMTRATWLSADHTPVRFGRDGGIYYLTRDPLDGYVQLFRTAP